LNGLYSAGLEEQVQAGSSAGDAAERRRVKKTSKRCFVFTDGSAVASGDATFGVKRTRVGSERVLVSVGSSERDGRRQRG
jgi:hypothetical protein